MPRTPAQPIGCLRAAFAIGLTGLVCGTFLLARWETLGGVGKAGAVFLVAVGSILVLPQLGFWGFQLFLKVLLRRVAGDFQKAAEQILAGTRGMYEKEHTFRGATDADFAGLDRDWYARHTQELTDRGYRHVGDVVDDTIAQLTGVTPVIRLHVSPDGTTTVAMYHLVPPNPAPREAGQAIGTFDVVTEFTDGTFLCTVNTLGQDVMTPPPGLERRQFARHTTLADLLRTHEPEKHKLLAAKSAAVGCVVIVTLADALDSEKRQQSLKNAYRKKIGYVHAEEVRRIGDQVDPGGTTGSLAADAIEREKRRPPGDDAFRTPPI